MTDSKLVFLDTSPIIYFLERNTRYYECLSKYLKKLDSYGVIFYTSVVSIEEYLVTPLKNDDSNLVRAFYEFLEIMDINVIHIDEMIADDAAHVRAKYGGIKGMDALQLAAFEASHAEVFLTNDKQLVQYSPSKVKLVDDLMSADE
ncbi:MAG: PIN domain-containing protein [Schwartzia sp.]|nr:PIN domain-containing protein [Schwartzia sp. (in: firmicutes)]